MKEFVLQTPISDKEAIIRETIKQTFTYLSLLTDDLISVAESETKTKEEYNAFMKGAAFMFYQVCQRTDKNYKIASERLINTPEDAINHCKDLMPFLTENEKAEHIKLINWLTDYINLKNE